MQLRTIFLAQGPQNSGRKCVVIRIAPSLAFLLLTAGHLPQQQITTGQEPTDAATQQADDLRRKRRAIRESAAIVLGAKPATPSGVTELSVFQFGAVKSDAASRSLAFGGAQGGRRFEIVSGQQTRSRFALSSMEALSEFIMQDARSLISRLDAELELTDRQAKKLLLAARLTLPELLRAAASLEKAVQTSSSWDLAAQRSIRSKLADLNDAIRECLIIPESLFQKTLTSQLTARQETLLTESLERKLFRQPMRAVVR